jgi:hypothetical protein
MYSSLGVEEPVRSRRLIAQIAGAAELPPGQVGFRVGPANRVLDRCCPTPSGGNQRLYSLRKGFQGSTPSWVAERMFGWLTRWRRLNRNYKHTLSSGRAVVQVALIGIMARRLAKTYK